MGAAHVVGLSGQRTQLVAAAPEQVLHLALQAVYLEVVPVVSQKNPVTSVPERLAALQALPILWNPVAHSVTVSTPVALKVHALTLSLHFLQAATTVAYSA